VCAVDEAGFLTDINERTSIERNDTGVIVYQDADGEHPLPDNCMVSMNFLCYAPGFVDFCETGFHDFLQIQGQELKSEFYLPTATKNFIQQEKGIVQVISTDARWFGVTYQEDAPGVQNSINELVAAGEYPNNLWA
jgi:hypothetical protein